MLESLGDPLGFIFSHFVFDTQTAWFRIFIWETGVATIAQSPWFGVGWVISQDYGIPYTVDSIWLLWALTYGIPGSALFGLSMLGATSFPTQRRSVSLTSKEMKLCTTISIVIFLIIFLGFTVDFFGSGWILIPILLGIRAHLSELARPRGLDSAGPLGLHQTAVAMRNRAKEVTSKSRSGKFSLILNSMVGSGVGA
jgi:O-antigen ligase